MSGVATTFLKATMVPYDLESYDQRGTSARQVLTQPCDYKTLVTLEYCTQKTVLTLQQADSLSSRGMGDCWVPRILGN